MSSYHSFSPERSTPQTISKQRQRSIVDREVTAQASSSFWRFTRLLNGHFFILIDHKGRHSIEEFPKDLLGLCRQRSFPQSTIHQAHPSVADSLIYRERRMPRAEAGMASLFDVSLRPAEPTDQEISEALLGTWKIARRVHGPQKVVLRDLLWVPEILSR